MLIKHINDSWLNFGYFWDVSDFAEATLAA